MVRIASLLTASLALASAAHEKTLFSRQANNTTLDHASQKCQTENSGCQNFVTIINGCGVGLQSADCICTSNIVRELGSCLSCVVKALEGDAAAIAQAKATIQPSIDSFGLTCAQALSVVASSSTSHAPSTSGSISASPVTSLAASNIVPSAAEPPPSSTTTVPSESSRRTPRASVAMMGVVLLAGILTG